MTTSPPPKYHVGDTLPALSGTCTADQGNGTQTPVDGTSASSVAHVLRPDATVLSRPVAVNATGAWSLAWQTDDLNQIGQYIVEIEMTPSPGSVQTFGPATMYVIGQIA